MFVDPTGFHIIVSLINGNDYYIHIHKGKGGKKKDPVLISKLKVNVLFFYFDCDIARIVTNIPSYRSIFILQHKKKLPTLWCFMGKQMNKKHGKTFDFQ